MARKSKINFLSAAIREHYQNGDTDVSLSQIEHELKGEAAKGNVNLNRGRTDYEKSDVNASIAYSMKLLEDEPELLGMLQNIVPEEEKKRLPKNTKAQTGGWSGPASDSWEHGGTERGSRRTGSGPAAAWRDRSGFRSKGPAAAWRDRSGFRLGELFDSPFGKILLIFLALVAIYLVFGDGIYSFLTSGLPFRIILGVMGVLAVLGFIRLDLPVGVKALIIGAIVMVGVYKVLGPEIYAFLTSGVVFKGILGVLALGGSIALLRANINMPFLVRIGVLGAVWLAIAEY